MALGKADLVLHDGKIYGHPESDSLAVSGGRILAHGVFKELKGLVGSSTHLIKLAGRVVLPGLIDSHLHFLEAASVGAGLQLSKVREITALLSELRRTALRTPPGNWLKAFGCDESMLKECRGPTREELDDAVPRNPLRIRHQTLHASWLNSKAIASLGLEKPDSEPPPGARLIRNDAGRLTGLVVGMEQWLTRHLPLVTFAQIEARARLFSRELASAGVTSFTDATARNGADETKLFADLLRHDAITQRVFMMIGAPHLGQIEQARKFAEPAGIGLVAMKMMPGETGGAQIGDLIVKALEEGLGVAFHATELEELEDALSSIESARRRPKFNPYLATRFRIEHGGIIPPDYIARLASIGAWVVTNPGFIHFRGLKYRAEPGLIPYLYRALSLLKGGVQLAGATDAPVTPARPMMGVATACSRLSAEGADFGRSEALDITEALDLFMRRGADLIRLGAGQLEPGLLADLAVFPLDPLALKPSDLINLQADITIIGGRVVFERSKLKIVSDAAGT